MSFGWITHQINETLERFSNSVTELKHRCEDTFQGLRRQFINHELRITTLEQRPVCDEALVERILRKMLAEQGRLLDQRKDSADPQVSTSTGSNSGMEALCARCHGPLVEQDPMILPSFDEFSRGIDPMDMSFERIVPSEELGEAWRENNFGRLSQRDPNLDGDLGEDSEQDDRLETSASPYTNGVADHHRHSVDECSPNTRS